MNGTVATITARALLGRRRFLLLLPLPVLLIGLAALAHAAHPDPTDWGAPVLAGLGYGVVLPMVALLIGTAVLGAEIDDGTVVHLLATPVARRDIVLAKLAVATGITAVVGAGSMFVAGTIVDGARLGAGLALASVLGAAAYSAVFLALSLLTRRPVLFGLLYVLIWEGLLGNLLAGSRLLSIQQYMLTIAARAGDTTLLTHRVSLPAALVMTAVFLIGGTLVAIERLRSFTLTGETA